MTSLRRYVLAGALLALVGGYVSFASLSLCALYQPICDGRWDSEPGCRAIVLRGYASLAVPLVGLVTLLVAACLAIRRRRRLRTR